MDLSEQKRGGPALGWGRAVLVLVFSMLIGAAGVTVLMPRLSALSDVTGSPLVDTAKGLISSALTSPSSPAANKKAATQAAPTVSVAPTVAPASAPAAAAAVPSNAPVAPTDQPIVAVVQKVGPAVVTVVNQLPARASFGGGQQPEALGSGVIIDTDGHIVTNNHVVAGGGTFQVIFSDGRKVTATLVGRDPISDVAVLKVGGTVPAVASFADSSTVQPGEEVVAIGSALGNFRNTVTHGIISGTDRTLDDPTGPGLSGLLQTDAPINHGNSGGPLLNLNGEIIGLNTAVVRSTGSLTDIAEGLGFAIPSNTVKQISDQLIKTGSVPRPFLGISYQSLSPQIAAYYGLNVTEGALIQSVEAGSPAEKAGLQQGDVVTAISGTTLDEEHTLAAALLNHKVGDTVQLAVTRDGQSLTLSATLVTRPASAG
jgi:2-alkenal reductase